MSQIRDRAEAEDIVHDVFLRLWRGRAELRPERSLRAYLLAAVRHRVIDVVRHRATDARTIEYHPDLATITAEGADRSHADPAQFAELDAAIRRAIAELPDRCRTAFLLCREHDLTYAEAAEVMGISAATVKTQIARALASLRSSLAPFLTVIIASLAAYR